MCTDNLVPRQTLRKNWLNNLIRFQLIVYQFVHSILKIQRGLATFWKTHEEIIIFRIHYSLIQNLEDIKRIHKMSSWQIFNAISLSLFPHIHYSWLFIYLYNYLDLDIIVYNALKICQDDILWILLISSRCWIKL